MDIHDINIAGGHPSVLSLPSKRTSIDGELDDFENDIMMQDLRDAGILDDDDLEMMMKSKHELIPENEEANNDDMLPFLTDEEELRLNQNAVDPDDDAMMGRGNDEEDGDIHSLMDSSINVARSDRVPAVPLVNQEVFDGPVDNGNDEGDDELHILPTITHAAQSEDDFAGDIYHDGVYHDDVVDAFEDQPKKSASKEHSYQHEAAKPRFAVGKEKLSISQAQLYGLLGKDGNIQLRSSSPSRSVKDMRSQVERLSRPHVPSTLLANEEEEKNLTFQPKRSAQALAAMKNKLCGYDFMDRINNRGGFLDRITPDIGKKKKIPQSQYDALKQDYDAKLDKLQCPKCLKPQSFDEHFENRRVCTACHVKFEKLNVSSGLSFLTNVKAKEAERVEKLKRIEREMYGDDGKSSVVNKCSGPKTNPPTTALPPIQSSRPKSAPPKSKSKPTPAATPAIPEPLPPQKELPKPPIPSTSKTSTEKMLSLAHEKSNQAHRVLSELNKYPNIAVEVVDKQPTKPSQSRPKSGSVKVESKPAGKVAKPLSATADKMQQLVQL